MISISRVYSAVVVAVLVVAQGLLGAGSASASNPLTGPVFPLDGITVDGEGSMGREDGRTWTYTADNLVPYDAVWWGPWDSESLKFALDGDFDDPDETLTFDADASDLEAGVGIWTGSTTVHHFEGGAWIDENLPTRLVVTIGDGSLVDAGSVGIDAGVGAVHAISGDYTANVAVEAFKGSWQPAVDLYDSLNTDPDAEQQVRTSVGFGFYYILANRPPVANDVEASVEQYGSVVIDVLANDEDPDGDELTIVAVSDPSSGTATVNDDQTITYTASPYFRDEDSFTYTISDGEYEDTATVTVLEDGCGEDGPVSQPIDRELEPFLASIDPALAKVVHDVNCAVVVTIEEFLPQP